MPLAQQSTSVPVVVDNDNWFCHTLLSKKDGAMVSEKHKVADYVVPIAEEEKDLYDKQRVAGSAS